MGFKVFLESKELTNLSFRPLSPVEYVKARAARDMLVLIKQFLKSRSHTELEVKTFSKELESFARKIPFAAMLSNELKSLMNSAENAKTARDNARAAHKHLAISSTAIFNAMKSGGNIHAMRDHAAAIETHLKGIDHGIDLSQTADSSVRHRIYIQPSFFGPSGRLLDSVADTDIEKIEHLDFDKPLFTGIPFPTSKGHDPDYLLYFLQQLSTEAKPTRVMHAHDFRTLVKVQLANNDDYAELLKITDLYLHGNDKKLIPKIAELINKIPLIREANEKKKKTVKVVYRGLGFGEDDDHPTLEEIDEEEHKRKYVATSTSRHAARNFALQKGHLESDDSARAAYSVIIEYKVSPESILFDTSVVDTVFNESEIVIDASKAEIISVDEVSPR